VTIRAVPLKELCTYLDRYLRLGDIPDDSNAWNGLQVENSGLVSAIVAAVDASQRTIDGVLVTPQAESGTLLLVHHGLFWDGKQPLTGRRYHRIRSLLTRNTALYSAHIPLDVHKEVGNNAVLARALGMVNTTEFGTHKGILLGVAGELPAAALTRSELSQKLAQILSLEPTAIRLLPGGPEKVLRVGVITGGAGSAIGQAKEAGCDTFITGEGAAHSYFDAMELGVNVLYAGHYATETVGVRALAEHLGARFELPWEFHDHPTGM
jgi:dinuclear metal center YbgI/SA1388 family protein